MSMQLFYIPELSTGMATLSEEESRHAVRVMRMGVGDELYATDGKGGLYRCAVLNGDAKHCEVQVVEREETDEREKRAIHVAVAPTKNPARTEWMVEKVVELGATRITPIICHHSERSTIKSERLEKIAISAMKQSLGLYKPIIDKPTDCMQLISEGFEGQRLMAHCEGHRSSIREIYSGGSDVQILIGPEGDFSPEEIAAAKEAGFIPITLGNRRLRTETAAIASVAFVSLVNSMKDNEI